MEKESLRVWFVEKDARPLDGDFCQTACFRSLDLALDAIRNCEGDYVFTIKPYYVI